MSRNNGKSPRIDLRLNLSRARAGSSSRNTHQQEDQHDQNNNNNHNNSNNNSPRRSSTSSSSGGTASPASSCVSSDEQPGSPGSAMVLVGCPQCMMYVMLSEHDPKCPKCKSTVLVDFQVQRGGKKN